MMKVEMTPIGFVRTTCTTIPRHWSVSDVEGELVIDAVYQDGLKDIQVGDQLIVLFWFHKSRSFQSDALIQKPPHLNQAKGVFSICSPIRPNPIGLSIVDVLSLNGNRLRVRGIDMLDGTPILDLKPVTAPDTDRSRTDP